MFAEDGTRLQDRVEQSQPEETFLASASATDDMFHARGPATSLWMTSVRQYIMCVVVVALIIVIPLAFVIYFTSSDEEWWWKYLRKRVIDTNCTLS